MLEYIYRYICNMEIYYNFYIKNIPIIFSIKYINLNILLTLFHIIVLYTRYQSAKYLNMLNLSIYRGDNKMMM